MKNLLFILLIFFLSSCEKDDFDINNPEVETFVNQILSGTYSQYEKGVNGENLWLKMPNFTEKHIQALIYFSKDTTHVTAYPINPISSRFPFPSGRNYYILSECLLWTVEGIINGRGYGSLDPYLIDTSLVESERYKGLKGTDILKVQGIYNDWWADFKDSDWEANPPLENTSYVWF